MIGKCARNAQYKCNALKSSYLLNPDIRRQNIIYNEDGNKH